MILGQRQLIRPTKVFLCWISSTSSAYVFHGLHNADIGKVLIRFSGASGESFLILDILCFASKSFRRGKDGYSGDILARTGSGCLGCILLRGDGYLGEVDLLTSFDSLASSKDAEERHCWKSFIQNSEQGERKFKQGENHNHGSRW